MGFGVFLLLSTKINKLNMEKKFFPKRSKASYPMSFVFGPGFCGRMDSMRGSDIRYHTDTGCNHAISRI